MDYETNRIITQEELNKMGKELSNYAEALINQQFKKISNDMNYEQKYKEANDKIAAKFGTNVAKEIFTDLYESEDEKIRKFLIKWIQDNYYHGTTEIPTKTLIAWLEKQGEKKPADELAWSEGDEVLLSSVINSLLIFEDSGASKMKIEWLKSLKQRIKRRQSK